MRKEPDDMVGIRIDNKEKAGKTPKRRHSRFSLWRVLGAVALALVMLGLVWLAPTLVTNLIEGLLKLFGLGVVLAMLWVGVIGWLVWRPHLQEALRRLRRWNRWLGVLLLSIAGLGLLAFLPIEGLEIYNVPLREVTAGGSLGLNIIGAPDFIGMLRLIGLSLAGIILIAPSRFFDLLLKLMGWLLRLSLSLGAAIFSFLRLVVSGLARAGPTAMRQIFSWLLHLPQNLGMVSRLLTQEHKTTAGPTQGYFVVPPTTGEAKPVAEEADQRQMTEMARELQQKEEKAKVGGWKLQGVAQELRQRFGEHPAPQPVTVRSRRLPSTNLLNKVAEIELGQADIEKRAKLIEEALASYGVEAKVTQINPGPTVTQFGIEPGWHRKYRKVIEKDQEGKVRLDKDGNPKVRLEEVSKTRVKIDRITSLANDLALALAAPSVRVEAPVPGKSVIGIEVPNSTAGLVALRSGIESPTFQKLRAKTKLALALGKGAGGETVVSDLSKMPHLLIAGATGSGKTVCLNSIITCLLMHAAPDEVRFLMIDPKGVELVPFNDIPHLIAPVVSNNEKAVKALQRVNQEMDNRYQKLASMNVRNIEGYNKSPMVEEPLPYLVLIIDELADLMLAVPDTVEPIICRLAQLARATGIHLVMATQRPSVDVVTGLIKANFPTRISFAVTSQVDSRTILDTGGAEKLLGRGDMLYMPPEAEKPKRLQGSFTSDQEIEKVVRFWRTWIDRRSLFPDKVAQAFTSLQAQESLPKDPVLEEAKLLALKHNRLSSSFLQRKLRIGYPRAARLMELLEEEGIVATGEMGKSREVLVKDTQGRKGEESS